MIYSEKESSTVGFKVSLPKNDQIVKTIVGFCNQSGGKLLIGVADNGQIVGIPEKEIEQVQEYLEKSIYESTHPVIIPQVYAQNFNGKMVLIVQVVAGMNKPYFVKSEGLEKGVYIRIGRSTTRATQEMLEELKLQARGRSFDSTPVYQAALSDLSEKKIDTFLQLRAKFTLEARAALIASYRIVIEEHVHRYPTVAGILAFGNNPQQFFSQAFIICTYFQGVSGRIVLATQDCMGTLVEQFAQAQEFIFNRLNRSFVIDGPIRRDILEVPVEALREMLINAIVHRNYHIQAPLKIALYENRIEIFSPGSFPDPAIIHNLQAGLTYIRNSAIAKILRHAGLVETLGSGFRVLFESYEQAGLPTPEVVEGDNYVKVILPRKPLRAIHSDSAGEALDRSRAALIKLLTRSGELVMADVLEQTKLPRSTAGRKLKKLVDEGVVQRSGSGRGTRYSLATRKG